MLLGESMINVQELFLIVTAMIKHGHGAARADFMRAYLCEFTAGSLIMGDCAVAQPPEIDLRWLESNNNKLT